MLDWPALTAIAACCAIVGGFAHFLYTKATHDSSIAEIAKSAQITAAAAVGKVDILFGQLNSHQIETARTVGKFEALLSEYGRSQVSTEQRFAKAFEDNAIELKELNQRIDRVLEGMASKREP